MSEPELTDLDLRSMALAGVFGASLLVQKLADDQTASADDESLQEALVRATVLREPDDWKLVFSNLGAFREAANASSRLLANQRADRRVLLYGVQLIQLAELLNQQPAVRNRLAELLDALTDDSNASLAAVYRNSISNLGQRIQVTGAASALQREDTASAIRALLLCGVRMAWLWLRLGGKRRHLVFSRRRIVNELRALADQLPTQ